MPSELDDTVLPGGAHAGWAATASPALRRLGPWRPEEGASTWGSGWIGRDGNGRRGFVIPLGPLGRPGLHGLVRVHHPVVPPVWDQGEDPEPYLVVQAPEGHPVPATELPADDALRVLGAVADGLAACHRVGVHHGALRPETVLRDGRCVSLVGFTVTAPNETDAWGAAGDVGAWARLAEFWLGGVDAAPAWLQALLFEAASPDPRARPSAARIADAFVTHGVPLPTPTAQDLQGWLAAAYVPSALLERGLTDWLTHGGAWAYTGVAGSGRSRWLARVADALVVADRAFVVLHPTPRPWASVRAALQDAGLPGLPEPMPDVADVWDRAADAAEALLRRAGGALTVLVDDHEELDDGTRATVEALHRRGVAIAVTGRAAPSWTSIQTPLPRLERPTATALVRRAVGLVDANALIDAAGRGGLPHVGELLDAVHQAWTAGTLRWDRRAFRWDGPPSAIVDLRPVMPALPADAEVRDVGALVALASPVPQSTLTAVFAPEVVDRALDGLRAAGWVRGQDVIRCVSSAVARALWMGASDPASLCGAWADVLLTRRPMPRPELAWVLVGANDVERLDVHACRAVEEALAEDLGHGLVLVRRLQAVLPSPELPALEVEALVRAGRHGEAERVGKAWFAEHDASDVRTVRLWMALAAAAVPSGPDAVLARTEGARALLDGQRGPTRLAVQEADAWIAQGEFRRAEAAVVPRSADPPNVDDPDGWLAARTRLARIRVAREGQPEAGLAVLEPVPESFGVYTFARTELERLRGRLLRDAGRPGEAALRLEAVAGSRALPFGERWSVARDAADAWSDTGDLGRAIEGWERAVAGFEIMGASREASMVRVPLAAGLVAMGRLDQAEAEAYRALGAETEDGGASAFMVLADVAMGRQRLGRASRHLDAADDRAVTHGVDRVLAEVAQRRAALAILRRQPDALAHVVQAHNAALALDLSVTSAYCDALRAVGLARQGHARSVRQFADQALETARRTARPHDRWAVELWVARAWQALGRLEDARAGAERVHAEATRAGWRRLAEQAADVLLWTAPADDLDRPRLERWTGWILQVTRPLEASEIVQQLAVAALDMVDGQQAWVAQGPADARTIVAQAGVTRQDVPWDVITRIASLQRPLAVHTPAGQDADVGTTTATMAGTGSWIGAPLMHEGRCEGVVIVHVADRVPGEGLTSLHTLGQHAALALQHAEDHAAAQAQVRCAHEVMHDVRNPLSGIAVLARHVADEGQPLGDDEVRALADAADHAVALLDRSMGSPDAPNAPLDLGDVVAQWSRSLEPAARRANVSLLLDTAASGPVRGAPTTLRRVLTNLVGNAIKYTPPGGAIRVQTVCEDTGLAIVVEDTGPGIPEAVLDRIFEPGVQGPAAAPGHGLGLAIVRRLCKELGGQVTAENLEHGSRFTVRLPRAAAETTA